MNLTWFNAALAEFARSVQASVTRRTVLVLDNAGWHRSEKVVVPEGIHLLFLPPYSPELQPAERLWKVVEEALVNRRFETLDDLEHVLVHRCQTLMIRTEAIYGRTHSHWEPSAEL